jgi:hypothetical protein
MDREPSMVPEVPKIPEVLKVPVVPKLRSVQWFQRKVPLEARAYGGGSLCSRYLMSRSSPILMRLQLRLRFESSTVEM